jgi:hypothetical protein
VAPKLAEMGQILKLLHTSLSLKYSRRTAAAADSNKDDSDFGGKNLLKSVLRPLNVLLKFSKSSYVLVYLVLNFQWSRWGLTGSVKRWIFFGFFLF